MNSVGINISRAIGPALGGVITASFGIAAPFWINAGSNLGSIGALVWWRAPIRRASQLPAERFASAIRTGIRHARFNSHLRATMIRAVGFFLFASCYWALLPLVARNQLHGGATLYGILLGAIGLSAIVGAFALPWLKQKLGPNKVVAVGSLATAASIVLFGIAHNAPNGHAGLCDRRQLVDRGARQFECLGAAGTARMGEGARARDLCNGVFWRHDLRQRRLGSSCQRRRSAARSFQCCGRRGSRGLVDLAVASANRVRSGPHAFYVMAHPGG